MFNDKINFNSFMRVGEAANYLGVSASTLRNWDRSGKLNPTRHPINKYRLYNIRDLNRVISGLKND